MFDLMFLFNSEAYQRSKTSIFAKYHKRLQIYVNQATDAQRSVDSSSEVSSNRTKYADNVFYGNKQQVFRVVCELLACCIFERIYYT